ncbi:hypothetical protein J5N97_029157 [Dioscorea zingiberensis]|uniref:non-specific serine/threonine protein kinase n=1 Tax=Dioscorea zingiberensis TaxID=325984 RepID=A0A9D5H5M3_9LILI|nr:hypothetical protein J5N97_029157 [Dioscorea zingiberensis]
MAVEEMENGENRPEGSPPRNSRKNGHKLDVYNEVLRRLKESDCPDARSASFDEDLWAHFNRLPARYAMDVNVERAEDVLTHKRLLQLAHDPANRPAFDVRIVQSHRGDSSDSNAQEKEDAQCSCTILLAFGTSVNLEALVLESNNHQAQDGDRYVIAISHVSSPIHEITFSTEDKPKILSQLTSLLSDIGLNIEEAHAFSTNDGYSLDVFVVTGWPYEEIDQLRNALQRNSARSSSLQKHAGSKINSCSFVSDNAQAGEQSLPIHVQIPTDGTDVWEIDFTRLNFGKKVASGSYGDLYRGTYYSQDVAIKVLKPERLNEDMQHEFAQEVYIMRKVRHRNVVQFIGACTRPPSLCIVTEFMSGGSIYDFLHKQKGVFKLPALLRVAIDVSKGMNYLHQNNIIHRDLKAANLLMDENEVVKVADFGVARVKAQSGVMTAETGTYRWMAPEVIEHKPYDHKADVFSFAIVLWELLTGKLPYEFITPLQAAVGVVQKGLRPSIPKHTHPKLTELLKKCWQQDPSLRPDFSEILEILQIIIKEIEDRPKEKSGGFLSVLKRSH